MEIPQKHRRIVMLGSFMLPVIVVYTILMFLGGLAFFPSHGRAPGSGLYVILFFLYIPTWFLAAVSWIVLTILYIVLTAKDESMSEETKALWIVLLVVVPVVGIPAFWLKHLKDLPREVPKIDLMAIIDDLDLPDGRQSPFGNK